MGDGGRWPGRRSPHVGDFVEGEPIRTQRQQVRCLGCRHLFSHDTPVRCDAAIFLAACGLIRCPTCRSREVSLTQHRTLAEDRAHRRGTSEDERVLDWLANGETGESSKAILRHMVGVDAPRFPVPDDVSAVALCALLLDRVPEWRPRMPEMARHPGWELLGPGWDELEAAFEADGGPGGAEALPLTHACLGRLSAAPVDA